MHDVSTGRAQPAARLPELDWSEISEPGCYLLVATGLLARVYPDAVSSRRTAPQARTRTRVVKLSGNPGDPLHTLRATASRHEYLVRF